MTPTPAAPAMLSPEEQQALRTGRATPGPDPRTLDAVRQVRAESASFEAVARPTLPAPTAAEVQQAQTAKDRDDARLDEAAAALAGARARAQRTGTGLADMEAAAKLAAKVLAEDTAKGHQEATVLIGEGMAPSDAAQRLRERRAPIEDAHRLAIEHVELATAADVEARRQLDAATHLHAERKEQAARSRLAWRALRVRALGVKLLAAEEVRAFAEEVRGLDDEERALGYRAPISPTKAVSIALAQATRNR